MEWFSLGLQCGSCGCCCLAVTAVVALIVTLSRKRDGKVPEGEVLAAAPARGQPVTARLTHMGEAPVEPKR
jgi:hypothetical protein